MKTVKCPGCSANLSYNLDSELLRCEYCATVSIINDNKIVETYPITNGNLMDAHSSFCSECGAKLIADVNTLSTKCVYCGNSIIYSEKINKVFKPEKILLFECNLIEAKKNAQKYIMKKHIPISLEQIEELKPVYVPYWNCSCLVDAEFEPYDGNWMKKRLSCKDVLLDSSMKIGDLLTDKLEIEFKLEKQKEFSLELLAGYTAEGYDRQFNAYYERVDKKLKHIITDAYIYTCEKLKIINFEKHYILLPFYYLNSNGIQILVNGQSGTVVSSKEYQKINSIFNCFSPILFFIICLAVCYLFFNWINSDNIFLRNVVILCLFALLIFGIYTSIKFRIESKKKYKNRIKEVKIN